MTGSWHLYRAGERWRRPHHRMRAAITTADGVVAVCFDAPTVELVRRAVGGAIRHPRLDALGPDLCRADADLATAVARLGTIGGDREIGVALLDQRIACGVGNVYKSEVLFACGIDPFTPVTDLGDDERRQLVATAHRLLLANLDRARRTTVPGGLAVYGRTGRPCRRCRTPIRVRRQGEQPRATYWCPTCQC